MVPAPGQIPTPKKKVHRDIYLTNIYVPSIVISGLVPHLLVPVPN
jgi:hypothetical protein